MICNDSTECNKNSFNESMYTCLALKFSAKPQPSTAPRRAEWRRSRICMYVVWYIVYTLFWLRNEQKTNNKFQRKKLWPCTTMNCHFIVLLLTYLHFWVENCWLVRMKPSYHSAAYPLGLFMRIEFATLKPEKKRKMEKKRPAIINHQLKSTHLNGKIVLQTYIQLVHEMCTINSTTVDLQFCDRRKKKTILFPTTVSCLVLRWKRYNDIEYIMHSQRDGEKDREKNGVEDDKLIRILISSVITVIIIENCSK